MTGKSRIAFWTITLIILFGLLSIVGYMMINEYQEEIVYQNLTPDGYEEIQKNENNELLTFKKNGKYGILNVNGNIIENALYNKTDIAYGYDNYYRLFTSDGRTLIKRNGKLIKDITNYNDNYILLKDESDKSSSYIIYLLDNDMFATTKIKDDTYVANVLKDNKYNAKILNIKDGITNELEGFIGKVNNNSIIEKYLIQIIEDKINLLSIYDYSILLSDYSKIGDEENIAGYDYSGSIYNDNYITVCKDSKCGIVNNNNEIILPLEYDNIGIVEHVEPLYFAVENNDKYGIVNSNNEIVVDFQYDKTVAYNNTFILESNDKLLITDNKLNKQYELKLDNVNDVVNCTLYNDDYIKILINDMSNAGTPRKIIIVDKDNGIKEYNYEEFIDITNIEHKMEKDYYAIYSLKNNEVYIDVYDGLSIKKSFTLIQINEINKMYIETISSNEVLLKMKTNNGDYYTILNIDTGNVVINDALKKLNTRNFSNSDFVVDIENSNLVYYKNDLISKVLEENVISSIKVTDNVYIIKKLDNTVYLYMITRR